MSRDIFIWGTSWQGRWGDNGPTREPIYGNTYSRSSPVPLDIDGFVWAKVSSSRQSIGGLRDDGTLWAWGANDWGQIGDGTSGYGFDRSSPVSVLGGFTDWIDFSKGGNISAGLREDGSLWTWGRGTTGQIGDGTTASRSSPVEVLGGFVWKRFAMGDNHTLAIRDDRTLWAWGTNNDGCLGIGNLSNKSSPTKVTDIPEWDVVACGAALSGGIKISNRSLYMWGDNFRGQCGVGDNADKLEPTKVLGDFTDWKTMACGRYHALGVRENGTLWAWGDNASGELGNGGGSRRSSPVSVLGGFTDWVDAASGVRVSWGLREDGTLWGWGANYNGQLGVGNREFTASPVSLVPIGADWIMVGEGAAIGCVTCPPLPEPRVFGRFPLVVNPTLKKLFELPEGIDLSLEGNNIINVNTINGREANTISDSRFKKNIKNIENPLDTINSLRGVSFQWRRSGEESIGLIAQEVEDIIPEVVHDQSGRLGISYDIMVSVLIEAIKEHQKTIDDLEERIYE